MADEKTGRPRQTDDEYKSKLTPEQYQVARESGTERAFTGEYWNEKSPGVYHCICCDAELLLLIVHVCQGAATTWLNQRTEPGRQAEDKACAARGVAACLRAEGR